MRRGAVASAILAITLLSVFVFPGHTYLQQDTQIYVPILENQWSGALSQDLIVKHPHVNFTLYDELTNGLRWITRAPLQYVLQGEQLLFRGLGFIGIFWIALSLGLDVTGALVVTAIWALGAAIDGPAVLTIEYEPTPRSFAIPLLLLASGCALREGFWWAGAAAAAAFLLHAPTTWPFYFACALFAMGQPRGIRLRTAGAFFLPLAAALAAIVWIAHAQPVGEAQQFFDRLPARQEQLQRVRAAYNYVSTWWKDWIGQSFLFLVAALFALRRLRAPRSGWLLLGGLMLAGVLSLPLSYLLLEREHLALIPQVQPGRALLFVTAIAMLTAAAAGVRAAQLQNRLEAAAWFLFVLWIPLHARFFAWPGWRAAAVVGAFAVLLAWVSAQYRLACALLLALSIRFAGAVVTHRDIETRQLAQLAAWARTQPGMYAFPDSARDRSPGWFRGDSLQPVYVDWKGGGQVNYVRELGYEWWTRWNAVMVQVPTLEQGRALGIDFFVLRNSCNSYKAAVYRGGDWCVIATHSAPASNAGGR